jgi:hypothetical protein
LRQEATEINYYIEASQELHFIRKEILKLGKWDTLSIEDRQRRVKLDKEKKETEAEIKKMEQESSTIREY